MKVMKEETIKANTHVVTRFNRHRYSFSMEETMDHNEGGQMDTIGSNYIEVYAIVESFKTFICLAPMSLRHV